MPVDGSPTAADPFPPRRTSRGADLPVAIARGPGAESASPHRDGPMSDNRRGATNRMERITQGIIATMPTGRILGVDRDISRLVMGCDNQQTLPHASAMF